MRMKLGQRKANFLIGELQLYVSIMFMHIIFIQRDISFQVVPVK